MLHDLQMLAIAAGPEIVQCELRIRLPQRKCDSYAPHGLLIYLVACLLILHRSQMHLLSAMDLQGQALQDRRQVGAISDNQVV